MEFILQIISVLSILGGYFILYQINVRIMAAITLIVSPMWYLISERQDRLLAVLEFLIEKVGN